MTIDKEPEQFDIRFADLDLTDKNNFKVFHFVNYCLYKILFREVSVFFRSHTKDIPKCLGKIRRIVEAAFICNLIDTLSALVKQLFSKLQPICYYVLT